MKVNIMKKSEYLNLKHKTTSQTKNTRILSQKNLTNKSTGKNYRLAQLHKELVSSQKKKPYDYQFEAIANVVKGFETESRGQLIMACGTGKTLTSLWIQEKLNPKRTLVLFPSLALLRQTKNEWSRNRQHYIPYICVCSEKDIDDNEDDISFSMQEIDRNVTSDPQMIRQFLKKDQQVIVFSTYQSLPAVSQALKGTDIEFDIVFCDEAHKTAGSGKSCFNLVHDNDAIPAKRRLYMTATPKVFSKDETGQSFGMNNRAVFGSQFHKLSFRQAIDRGILVDYKIIIVGVLEKEIAEIIKNGYVVSDDMSVEEIAHNYSVGKFMDEWNARKVITFHGSVKKAQNFTKRHNELFPEVNTFHINGQQPTAKREKQLEAFDQSISSIVSNARCLTEGVDVPAIDAVFFCDPKNSHVDIMQALGRTLRRADHRGKNLGYIIVPTLHLKDSNIEQEVSESRFGSLIRVIKALNNHDETFKEKLAAQIGTEKASQGNLTGQYQKKIIEVCASDINFSHQLYTQCFEPLMKVRISFLELQKWLKQEGIDSQKKYLAAFGERRLPPGSPRNPLAVYEECKSFHNLFSREKLLVIDEYGNERVVYI